MLSLFRGVLHDVRRTFIAFIHLIRYIRQEDTPKPGISLFRTAGRYVVPGVPARYEAVVVNPTDRKRLLRLDLDFISRDHHGQPETDCAHAMKRFIAGSGVHSTILFTYDWRNMAGFEIDGVQFSSDEFRSAFSGPAPRTGLYSIRATLAEEPGEVCETLELVQELQP